MRFPIKIDSQIFPSSSITLSLNFRIFLNPILSSHSKRVNIVSFPLPGDTLLQAVADDTNKLHTSIRVDYAI